MVSSIDLGHRSIKEISIILYSTSQSISVRYESNTVCEKTTPEDSGCYAYQSINGNNCVVLFITDEVKEVVAAAGGTVGR